MPTTSSDTAVTFMQDVWWASKEGLVVLIDNMSDGYRANVANFLLRNAERYYTLSRLLQIEGNWRDYVTAGDEAFGRGSWGPVNEDPPTQEQSLAGIQIEVRSGEHTKWMLATKLYQRMARGIDFDQVKIDAARKDFG